MTSPATPTRGGGLRNDPAKKGPRRKPADPVVRKADEVRLREQWQVQYREWRNLVNAVKRGGPRGGRLLTDPKSGRLYANPLVAMRDSKERNLLATSKALADILGLSPEQEAKLVSIRGRQKRAQERRSGGGQ